MTEERPGRIRQISFGRLSFDFAGVSYEDVGPENGLDPQDLEPYLEQAEAALRLIASRQESGDLPLLDLPRDIGAADEIERFCDSRRKKFRNFVLLGIGGSALGNIALSSALAHPFYNLLPDSERPGPRLFVPDNIDPDMVSGLLDLLDPAQTLVNVVSKSGTTAETMANFLVIFDRLKEKLGWPRAAEHIVVTTDPQKGSLRKFVEKEGLDSFPVPPGVGGRFSVLSPVGLLSAAMQGIDIKALLAGAGEMAGLLKETDYRSNPAIYTAAALLCLDKLRLKSILVMMPYSQRLRDLADWFRQLWAESLGKKHDRAGKEVFAGQTPIKAFGATDQHSQMQLYTEGPNDKIICLVKVGKFDRDLDLSARAGEIDGLEYLAGHTMGELLNAECDATRLALTRAARPNLLVRVPEVEPSIVGQFIYFWELVTILVGEMQNIDPFDQPGVEAGKRFAYGLMGRAGFEKEKEEVERFLAET